MSDTPELVLCIPGPWDSPAALQAALAGSGHRLDATRLHDSGGVPCCDIAFGAADPEVSAAFRIAGPHWAGSAAMDAVDGHASVVYLAGRGGTREAAAAMMHAGAVLVDAGGLGVKVDSTGIAHGPAYWTDLCEQGELASAHSALVVFVVAGREVYSCGMHNFGLPEAVTAVDDRADIRAAADLLRSFTRYLLEAPAIEDGHTFSVSDGTPVYRIESATAVDYGPDSLFNNPYGSWRLAPLAADRKRGWWGKFRH